MPQKPDLYIVQKQTALERYTKRPLNIDFFEYLEKAGQSLESLVHAHERHVSSRDLLLQNLEALGIQYEVFNLDELEASGTSFFNPAEPGSGLQPESRIILSLGGDGTLLNASHYAGGDVMLVGINSCPEHSVGHLCSVLPTTIPQALLALQEGRQQVRTVRRLLVHTSRQHRLPLGLNDVLFCNRHPAATSRYQLSVVAKGVSEKTTALPPAPHEGSESSERTEKQLSSGLWVAAPAGSTAAIGSYGMPRLSLDSTQFLAAVREPYLPPASDMQLGRLVLNGEQDELHVFCRMRQGLVCVDGPDASALIGFGESLRLSLPSAAALRLVVGFGEKKT